MSSMIRIMKSIAVVGGLTALLGGLTGCGDEVAEHLACSAASECAISTDAGDQPIPECCTGFCVVQSFGCDSGYRYVRSDKNVGECVATSTCPVLQPEEDMSVPEDLAEPPADLSSADADDVDAAI